MNFIEQFFGLCPDGDSGLTEMLFLLLPFAIILVLLQQRRNARRAAEAGASRGFSLDKSEQNKI